MTAAAELTTITGAEAYAKAVEHAQQAEEYIGIDSRRAEQEAAVAQAFAAIAQAEVAARASAPQGCYPAGGWKRHTYPND
jgi:hypothetical protein